MNDYQRVCGVQARANLYELVLGMALVTWFRKPCCFSSGGLTLHVKGYALWVLDVDISLFPLLGFVHKSF